MSAGSSLNNYEMEGIRHGAWKMQTLQRAACRELNYFSLPLLITTAATRRLRRSAPPEALSETPGTSQVSNQEEEEETREEAEPDFVQEGCTHLSLSDTLQDGSPQEELPSKPCTPLKTALTQPPASLLSVCAFTTLSRKSKRLQIMAGNLLEL